MLTFAVRTMFIHAALHGVEASLSSQSSFLKLPSAFVAAVGLTAGRWLTVVRSVLSLLHGLEGCDPAGILHCLVSLVLVTAVSCIPFS